MRAAAALLVLAVVTAARLPQRRGPQPARRERQLRWVGKWMSVGRGEGA